MKTSCGFDREFFEIMKLALSKMSEPLKHGVLLLDEITTRESVNVDTKNLSYEGLIDFGDGDTKSTDFTEKANHGLVLMFQSIDGNHCQPVAVFASRGPVKGEVIAQLITKAIVLLEKIGAKMHGIVSDGASLNRKFWATVGVCGTKGNLRNYFDHPVANGRKIYVFSDTPHLMKTIRNRLFNQRVLQVCE